MEKEAKYYESLSGNKVRCHLCPQNCLIKEGQRGSCGVRENKGGKLIALNYAKVAAIADDPIEKKPLYHFYPGTRILSLGTVGCNLHCLHCQNHEISQTKIDAVNNLRSLSIAELSALVKERGYLQVAFTYNEPIVWYEYLLEAAQVLKTSGIRVVLVTNGYINPAPLAELLPYMDAFSLDIKWANNETAKKLSGVKKAEPVFETAKTIFNSGKHLEIVTNIVDHYNDDLAELRKIAKFIAEELSAEVAWHISRAFPYYKLSDIRPTPLATIDKARQIGEEYGIKQLHYGNI